MKITEVRLGLISVPLRVPFKTALRSVSSVEDVIVEIHTDTGAVGYGEAPPTGVITGDTTGAIIGAIRDHIAKTIIGRDVDDFEDLMIALNACIQKNTSAKAAVDMALYDLWGKLYKAPVYRLLGGSRREFETDITISVNPVEEMVRDSLDAVRRGYTILKVKVGREGLKDVERIEEIRKAVGPRIALRVDANQGWNAKEAVRIIRAMEDKNLDIDLVEQPVNAHDLMGMKLVTGAVYTPILADESVFSAEDAVTIIRERAADLINIKLMKTGGIWGALKICSIAETFGVECMIGCMLESKLAVTAGAHLAAAKSIITRADLDGPSLCKVDPFEGGPQFLENRIVMTDAPGLGITGIPASFES